MIWLDLVFNQSTFKVLQSRKRLRICYALNDATGGQTLCVAARGALKGCNIARQQSRECYNSGQESAVNTPCWPNVGFRSQLMLHIVLSVFCHFTYNPDSSSALSVLALELTEEYFCLTGKCSTWQQTGETLWIWDRPYVTTMNSSKACYHPRPARNYNYWTSQQNDYIHYRQYAGFVFGNRFGRLQKPWCTKHYARPLWRSPCVWM